MVCVASFLVSSTLLGQVLSGDNRRATPGDNGIMPVAVGVLQLAFVRLVVGPTMPPSPKYIFRPLSSVSTALKLNSNSTVLCSLVRNCAWASRSRRQRPTESAPRSAGRRGTCTRASCTKLPSSGRKNVLASARGRPKISSNYFIFPGLLY